MNISEMKNAIISHRVEINKIKDKAFELLRRFKINPNAYWYNDISIVLGYKDGENTEFQQHDVYINKIHKDTLFLDIYDEDYVFTLLEILTVTDQDLLP